MSVTWQLILLAAAAVVVMAILVVGTLVAADIIPLGRRQGADPAPGDQDPREGLEQEPVESFVPPASSLAAGAPLGGSR